MGRGGTAMRLSERLLLAVALVLGWVAACHAAEDVPPADIEAFVREGCPHCASAEAFLSGLQQEQPALRIIVRDVDRDPGALERLQHVAEDHGLVTLRVPTFEVRGRLIVGYTDEASTGRLLREALTRVRPKPESLTVEFLGRTLSLDQVGLPLFTLALGLLDGFNPCSMWVLVLMLSLLAALNDRRRMFAIAGTFVAVQGVAYFVFMAAWLNLFLLVGLSRLSEIVIALLALFAGALHLKDAWHPGEGISLSIPAAAKPGIYTRMRRVLQADDLVVALIGVVVLGVLVQVVELMCTSGFPALYTRILTLQQLDSLSYYAYLLLYDAAYMLDDMIVLAIGVITLSQRRLQENEGRWLKLVSGVVMVGLGAWLLLR